MSYAEASASVARPRPRAGNRNSIETPAPVGGLAYAGTGLRDKKLFATADLDRRQVRGLGVLKTQTTISS